MKIFLISIARRSGLLSRSVYVVISTKMCCYFKQHQALVIFLAVIGFTKFSFGLSFHEATSNLKNHHEVEILQLEAKALYEKGKSQGDWGDPKIRIVAKNFPKDTLKDDESPMTGVEIGVSQKVALSNKYRDRQDYFHLRSEAQKVRSEWQYQSLLKQLWDILIEERSINEELSIARDEIDWIARIVNVSKKLYANGKITQQALLELQIRKSELETLVQTLKIKLNVVNQSLIYLVGSEKLNRNTIPWSKLEKENSQKNDLKEKMLVLSKKGMERNTSARKKSYIPDLTFSIGYTKRSNIDKKGDFISAGVSFPFPFFGSNSAELSKAKWEALVSEKKIEQYKLKTKIELQKTSLKRVMLENELRILEKKTIPFAQSSRKAIAKSYRLGTTGYIELLQSEFNLQKQKNKKSHVKRDLLKSIVLYKFLNGEVLSE